MKVSCNHCGWEGNDDELVLPYDTWDERCPKCNKGDALMDITTEEEDEAEIAFIQAGFNLQALAEKRYRK